MDKRLRFMTELIEPLRVASGSSVRLSRDHDPGYTGRLTRPQGDALLAEGIELLARYQDRLAAQDTFGVLLVLQGLDASGKDGVIKHVMSGVNPQAVTVHAFKQPSADELNHDFGSSSGSTTRRRTGSSHPAGGYSKRTLSGLVIRLSMRQPPPAWTGVFIRNAAWRPGLQAGEETPHHLPGNVSGNR